MPEYGRWDLTWRLKGQMQKRRNRGWIFHDLPSHSHITNDSILWLLGFLFPTSANTCRNSYSLNLLRNVISLHGTVLELD